MASVKKSKKPAPDSFAPDGVRLKVVGELALTPETARPLVRWAKAYVAGKSGLPPVGRNA